MRTGRPISTTIKEFAARLAARHPSVSVCSKKFLGVNTPLDFSCKECDFEWSTKPSSVMKCRVACPVCQKAKLAKDQMLTDAQIRKRIRHQHGDRVVLVGKYLGTGVPHKFKCLICNGNWTTQLNHVIRGGTGCPTCPNPKAVANRKQMGINARVPKDVMEKRLFAKHGKNIRMMGQYRGANAKHRFKCYTCLTTWKACPGVVARHTGCPGCANLVRKRKSKWGGIKELTIAGVDIRVQGYEPQAIQWLLNNRNVKINDLVLDNSGEVPVIPYQVGRRKKNYYPDIYIPKFNRIVEVKSTYTLGVKYGKDWRINQLKAKACLAAGYNFTLMVMHANGYRMWLPADWYRRDRKRVLIECMFNHADHSPVQRKVFKKNMTLR